MIAARMFTRFIWKPDTTVKNTERPTRPGYLLAVCASLFLAVLTGASSAYAWGDKRHRIVGAIARELLTPEAKGQIDDIMGGHNLPVFALYMDKNKAELDAQI